MSRRNQELQSGTFAEPAQLSTTDFPNYSDADVRIVISGSRQYQLHSSILKNGSPTMRALLRDEMAARLSKQAIKRGVTARFRLQLEEDTDAIDDGSGRAQYVLRALPLDSEGRTFTSSPIGLDLENGRAIPPSHLAYNAVFGAFYQIPIDLGDFAIDPLTEILGTAMSITEVAEYLQCVSVITKPIEATLLATGQTVHISIANSPLAWLDYAYRVRSRVLFREALIHAAGQYHMDGVQDGLNNIEPAVHDLLRKKADQLKEAMKQAIRRILTYYPVHIQREKTVGRVDKDNIGRASYANDIMTWIALVVLRHFFAQNVAEDQTHHAKNMGKEMVDYIMEGGDKYLAKPDLEDFHKFFPMSGKADNVLESKISDMKEYIKRFVRDLTKNESHLDLVRTPVAHFTCTVVDVNDYPWEGNWAGKQIQREESESDEDMMDADMASE